MERTMSVFKHKKAAPQLTIAGVSARAVIAPLSRPICTAVGTIPSAPLVLFDISSNEGGIGRSYIFAYTPLALEPIVRFIAKLGPELANKPIAPVALMRDFRRRFRLIGWQGLIGMAIAGLEMALWDATARALDVPLVHLLGGEPTPIAAYDSYGVVDPKTDAAEIAQSVERGFRAIKIKVGDGDLESDVATVAEVRRIIGPKIALMLDYNQSLTPVEARQRIARLAEFDIHWVEEPVEAEDIHGHARVRANSRFRCRPARIGGFRAIWRKRSPPTRATTRCSTS